MSTAARNSLAAGTRFGRYEVVADIASGGMAMVYLARALGAAGFQRLVAIKLMHAQYANDEEFVGMFMDEARLAARIRHPNVVATLDLENDDEGLYLVMEYIEGETLLALLRSTVKAGRRIPPSITLRIVLDMLNGLHAAHELTGDMGEPLRLVHRDISPHNVLVGIDGISRITDFGIARAEERMTATKDGQVKGKLAYMAPEQTTSGTVDRRVDLFATGGVLWEARAGRRLFAGQNDGEVLRNLLVNPISKVREFVPDLPEALEQMCMRALERDPDARFATAAQMADALEQAGGSVGIASNRAVSQFVREICGERIVAFQQRIRGPLSESGVHRPVTPRRRQDTDPERTTQRPELVTAAPSAVSVDASGLTPLGIDDVVIERARRPRSGAGAWAFLTVLILGAAGAGGYLWWRDQHTASHQSALTATPPTQGPSTNATSALRANTDTHPATAPLATVDAGVTSSEIVDAGTTVPEAPPAAHRSTPPATHRATGPRVHHGPTPGPTNPPANGTFNPEAM